MGNEINSIGVIDSGVGGLSMIIALQELLPSEEIIYIADPLHFPYGEKSKNELMTIVSPLILYLKESVKAKVIITACGTISSNCLEDLSTIFPVPLFGIIDPATKEAIQKTQTGKVVVLATTATVKSGAFRSQAKKINPHITIKEEAWPEFVEAIEKRSHQSPQWHKWIKTQFHRFQEENFDTMIMGCTHFALISSFFQEMSGPSFQIVNPTLATAQEVKTFLEQHQLFNQNGKGKKKIIVRGQTNTMEKTLKNYPALQQCKPEAFPEKYHFQYSSSLQRFLSPASTTT